MIKNLDLITLKRTMVASIIASGYAKTIDEPKQIDFYSDLADNEIKRSITLAGAKNGSGHDSFLKGIIVQFNLKYTQYWTPQLQRYNFLEIISSQSKMVSLTKLENLQDNCNKYTLPVVTDYLKKLIDLYNKKVYPLTLPNTNIIVDNKDEMFHYLLSNTPLGFELWERITTNYLQLKTVYKQRKNHKLENWKEFCLWIETLPNSWLITGHR